MNKVAITGGTGFIGAALIDALIAEGADVVALARNPEKIKTRDGLRVVKGDLDNEAALNELSRGADTVFHLAGLTHARDEQAFRDVNVKGAARTARIAADHHAVFVHSSSLSAREPHLSSYARSKADSEGAVRSAVANRPFVMLRLPAIYGPGDMALLPYFKLVRGGFAPEPRTIGTAMVTLLHVADAAGALVAAAKKAPPGMVYDVGDDTRDGRSWSDIACEIGDAFGKRPRMIKVPRGLMATMASVSGAAEKLLNRPAQLRPGQVNELFHPHWVARDALLNDAIDWAPRFSLKEGVSQTIDWYRDNGLL
ncbi:MAG: SDR family NAD(P)-dependent oxidoreductase [Pseudomonadota bacterium]